MKTLQLSEINNLVEICKILGQTPFYQKLGAPGVLAIYLTALELGLPPMYCLNGGLYNIQGKVSLSGNAINTMLLNAGWEIGFIEYTDKACELSFKYPKSARIEKYRYTIEEAKIAGYLGTINENGHIINKPKDNWLCHPKNMLFNRAIANGARMYAPNVIGNCFGIGELDNESHIPFSGENILTAQNEKPKINCSGLDDVEKFKERHNIKQGEQIYDYVLNIAQKKNIDTDQALSQCHLNEEKFIQSFKRFESQNLF